MGSIHIPFDLFLLRFSTHLLWSYRFHGPLGYLLVGGFPAFELNQLAVDFAQARLSARRGKAGGRSPNSIVNPQKLKPFVSSFLFYFDVALPPVCVLLKFWSVWA